MKITSAVETTLQQSGLSSAAVNVIRRVVMKSRLWPAERQDVLEELVSHFHEGLDAGAHMEDLLDSFGDPAETAPLIRRAKRRQRPLMWRATFVSFQVIALMLAASAAIYGGRAATLYLGTPVSGIRLSAAAVEPVADRTDARWQLDEHVIEDRLAKTGVHNERASAAAQNRDTVEFVEAVAAMFANARQCRSEMTVTGDLVAARIEAHASALIAEVQLDFGTAHRSTLSALLELPINLDGVRTAFSWLLDEMYTKNADGNGQLTGAGIELVRQLKDWHRPTLKDRLMEPLWYLFPADRLEVTQKFDEMVCAA